MQGGSDSGLEKNFRKTQRWLDNRENSLKRKVLFAQSLTEWISDGSRLTGGEERLFAIHFDKYFIPNTFEPPTKGLIKWNQKRWIQICQQRFLLPLRTKKSFASKYIWTLFSDTLFFNMKLKQSKPLGSFSWETTPFCYFFRPRALPVANKRSSVTPPHRQYSFLSPLVESLHGEKTEGIFFSIN